MSFGIREVAWLAVGAGFGANVTYGLHLWRCGPLRRQTVIGLPDGVLTMRKRLSRREVREIKRRWLAARDRGALAVFEVPPRDADPTRDGHGTSPADASDDS